MQIKNSLALFPCTYLLITAALYAEQSGAAYDSVVAACAPSAQLNDLLLLSEDTLVAVGDRGLLLQSGNAGRDWQVRATRVTASLKAVSFGAGTILAVGGEIGTYTGQSIGTVLRSTDQGESWQATNNNGLPRLVGCTYDGRRWIAWGDYSPVLKTACFESVDGGETWQPVNCPLGHIEIGFASGPGNATTGDPRPRFAAIDRLGRAVFSANQNAAATIASPEAPLGALAFTGQSWLAAGKSGELLIGDSPHNMRSVALPISPEARRQCRWECIDQVGENIWVAGYPGSILLHSPDSGRTWKTQSKAGHLPIRKLRFFDSSRGWAITALGNILATRDGGQTWYVQRLGAQRVGVLSVAANQDTVPWQPLVAAAWDDSLAVGSLCVTASDAVLDADFLPSSEQLLRDAAGRMGLSFHSRAPVAKPESMVDQLALELLVWRPDVILASSAPISPRGPTVDTLARQAVDVAQSSQLLSIASELGLSIWVPQKLVGVVKKGKHQYSESSSRVLSSVGLSVEDILFALPQDFRNRDVSMRTLWSQSSTAVAARSLLGGVPPSPQTQFSKRLLTVGNYQLVMGRVHRRKTLYSLVQAAQSGSQSLLSAKAWQQSLTTAVRAMPEREIGPSLVALAKRLKSPGCWAQYEQTLLLLTNKQPNSDAADWARLELLALPQSDELRAWSLVQQTELDTHDTETVQLASATRLTQAGSAADVTGGTISDQEPPAQRVWNGSPFGNLPNGVPAEEIPGAAVVSAAAQRSVPVHAQPVVETDWQPPHLRQLATWFPYSHSVTNPSAGMQLWPSTKLMTASVGRRNQEAISATGSTQPLETLMQNQRLLGWPQVARQEKFLLSGKSTQLKWVAHAATGASRPTLDGFLDDPCWQTAQPIELSEAFPAAAEAPATLAYWATDHEYLYLALRCEANAQSLVPLAASREYDSDLSSIDRIEILLDTDRDYCTAIHLGIGQDGRTFDSCADSHAYNPRWFVAVNQHTNGWVAEVAIRLQDLTTRDVKPGEAWAVSLTRRGPKLIPQSWSQLRTPALLPQAAGLLIFDSPQSN